MSDNSSSTASTGRPSVALLAKVLRARADWLDLPSVAQVPRPYISREQFRAAADLLEHKERLTADLLEALKAAADQFEFYGREHRKKQRGAEFNGIEAFIKERREKAETNERFAAMCRAAIAKADAPVGSPASENKAGV